MNETNEHNPDGLTPEQYGAPEWRLLKVGEQKEAGDEFWLTMTGNPRWEPITCFELIGCNTYRRRVADQSARIAELERRVEEARAELQSKLDDIIKAAERIDELKRRADHWCDMHTVASRERDTLRAQLAEREEDRVLLDEVQKRKLTITWNPRHDGFIIQEQEQVCGNIAHNPDLRAAIRAARAQPEDGK